MLRFGVGLAFWAIATHSAALSLGGVQGSVIIGRALDIGVSTSVDASQVSAGLCLRADVDYGDNRLPPSVVSVEVERLGLANTGVLRVRASRQVNEPLVSVTLSVGCSQQFTRTYTLLADVEPLNVTAAAAPVVVAPVAIAVPAPSSVPPGPSSSVSPLASLPALPSTPAPSRAAGAAASASPAPARAPVAPAAPAPVPASAPATIEPLDLAPPAPRPANVMPRSKVRPGTVLAKVAVAPAPDRSPETERTPAPAPAAPPPPAPAPEPAPAETGSRLELTPLELGPVPATGSVLQGDAAALGVDGGSGASAAGTPGTEGGAGEGLPEDAGAAQAQRLTTLEGELSQMRAEQERLRLALETMNTQLAEARSQTTSNAVVYGLATLVLLLLGVLVWLLRSRSAALNSAGLGAGVGTGFGATRLPSSLDNAAAGTAVEPAPDGATPAGSTPWWADSTHAPVKASGFTAVEVDEHPQEPDAAPASGFAHSQIEPNSLPLAAQDLADLVRQVEFFEVLGQGNEAIDALQTFIKTHPAQSELPYLLLMQLAVRHNTGQLPDLQRQYMRHFDLPAPQQQECAPDAPGLLEDPIWITRLQQLWPHPEAGAAVQAALTAHPEQSLLRRRTLPALLDLITLYEVWSALQEEATAEEPKEPTPSAASTVPAIPAASAGFADSQAEVVPETEFPAIDIDLSAYSLPAGASGAIRKSGSAAQDAPSAAAADKDLPPLDFDMGNFPEAPDSGKKT